MQQRRQARKVALQVLYQTDMAGTPPEEGLGVFYEHFDAPEAERSFTERLVLGVYQHRSELDQLITSASENWRVERMSFVDRNVLRMALYEMLFCADIPAKVSINEAIDLGKLFGSHDSGPFINGVLDHLLSKLQEEGRISDNHSSGK